MAVGDVFYQVMPFDDSPADQFLAKITVEDPANYNVRVDDTGTLIYSPKPELAQTSEPPAPGKYELIPHGEGLFRIRALRPMPHAGVDPGELGGIISSAGFLSQDGECWIEHGAKLLHGTVAGNAQITGNSVLRNGCHVAGDARVDGSTLDGPIHIQDNVQILDSQLRGLDRKIILQGNCSIRDSVVEAEGYLNFAGCTVQRGHLREQHDLVSYWTPIHGWLSAYPDAEGRLTFAVGCQVLTDVESLHRLAREYRLSDHDIEMLDAYLQIVMVARRSWARPAKSAHVDEPVRDDAAVPVPVIPQPAALPPDIF